MRPASIRAVTARLRLPLGLCLLLALVPLDDARSSPSAGPQGSWQQMAPAPTKRTEVAAAALDGKLYVVGGFSEPRLSNVLNLAITTAVEEYDPAADRWTARAPLPVGVHHAALVPLDGHLYLVGGFTKSVLSVWSPTAAVYRFDPDQNSWTAVAPMPTPRGALAAVALDGTLLAIGGYDGERNTGAVEQYDPATNTWTPRAPLPTPRDHLAAAAVGGRVYAIGGRLDRDYARNLAVTEAYDPGQDRWTRVADLPTARSGITAAVLGSVIYVLGGEAPGGTFATNEAYHPEQDRWETMAPMPTARHGLGSGVIGGHLYVASGGPTPGGSFSNVNERFTPPGPSPRTRAGARQVGAAMAVLALLADAGVLPPEGSREADRMIKAVIQFQAAFARSGDPAVRRLLDAALGESLGRGAPAAAARFREEGWTSEVLIALADYGNRHRLWEGPEAVELRQAFAAFNLDREDFELISSTVRSARDRLALQGQDFHAAFSARRARMPGS